jgi:hypothetical protein
VKQCSDVYNNIIDADWHLYTIDVINVQTNVNVLYFQVAFEVVASKAGQMFAKT